MTVKSKKILAGLFFAWILCLLSTVDTVAEASDGCVNLVGSDFSQWRGDTGKWKTVGKVFTNPANEKLLSNTPGHGVIVNLPDRKSDNLISKAEFGDIKAHIEFMVSKDSNSGVYFMGRYELQIFDSWRKKSAYPGIECGGIYERWDPARKPKCGYEGRSPRVNASRAPGQWQSFDVVFRAPRFDKNGHKIANARFDKIVHNGILVHENLHLTGPTRAGTYNDEKPIGPLMLQGDHGMVAFRNIRIERIDPNPLIRHVIIEPATAQRPRSDTASVTELSDGRLMVVYHIYEGGKLSGRDHGICRIWSKISKDGGYTWQEPRMLIDMEPGDWNVQAPAILRLKSGRLLLNCKRAHKGKSAVGKGGCSSSTMCIFYSDDEGKNFSELNPVWKRSRGQLLQGGTSSLVELGSGRILLPIHGGSGDQFSQKNSAWCYASDDKGKTWQRSAPIDLPKRGAMEASVAELDDGTLLMSLRTQLGGPYLSRSTDKGMTWSKPVWSRLESPESGTCLRRIPGSKNLVLFFNNGKFDKKHHHFGDRTPLTAAISSDNGHTWQIIGNLADDPQVEYTNLDCFFTSKGDAIVTYMHGTPPWNRDRISLKAAIISKDWFKQRKTSKCGN